jgi:hypothetical protein
MSMKGFAVRAAEIPNPGAVGSNPAGGASFPANDLGF